MPPGLRWTREGIHVHEDTLPLARRAFEVFAQVKSFRATAIQLNLEGYTGRQGAPHSVNSVAHVLRHPAYRGRYRWGTEEYVIQAPQVIDAETLSRADELLSQVAARPQRALKAKAVFAGLLRCPQCGRWLVAKPYSGRQAGRGRQYECAAANLPPKSCTNTKRRSESRIERALLPTIAQALREQASRVRATSAPRRQGQEIEDRLRRLDEARERSRLTYVDGHCTKEQMLGDFARIERARGELLALVKPVPHVNAEQLREAARNIERHWAAWSSVSKRELLQSMIAHIALNPDDLGASVITWRNE